MGARMREGAQEPPLGTAAAGTPPVTLVLASASPRRRELLRSLGVPFRVRGSDVPEPLLAGVPAERQAQDLAAAKARAVAAAAPGAVVLAADTIVVLDGAPLGKPADAAEACAMLRALRGRAHAVVTGIAGVPAGHNPGVAAPVAMDAAVTTVRMRDYGDEEIAAYVATGDPLDKAGAYAIQHPRFRPVAHIDGCYCNVMGLPLWNVRRLLARLAPTLRTTPPTATYARCLACPLRAP